MADMRETIRIAHAKSVQGMMFLGDMEPTPEKIIGLAMQKIEVGPAQNGDQRRTVGMYLKR